MVFYGASGHAKVVIEAWIQAGGNVTGLVDDNPMITSFLGHQVFHTVSHPSFEGKQWMVSIGSNTVRKRIAELLEVTFGMVLHPLAIISPSFKIGEGSVVLAGAIINSTTHVGKHCIINTGATIDHDCLIGDYAHIAPNATLCGGVIVGNETLIGAGSTIIPEIKIGNGCIIGAGSVVIRNVPDYCSVVGNPAKIIKHLHG